MDSRCGITRAVHYIYTRTASLAFAVEKNVSMYVRASSTVNAGR